MEKLGKLSNRVNVMKGFFTNTNCETSGSLIYWRSRHSSRKTKGKFSKTKNHTKTARCLSPMFPLRTPEDILRSLWRSCSRWAVRWARIRQATSPTKGQIQGFGFEYIYWHPPSPWISILQTVDVTILTPLIAAGRGASRWPPRAQEAAWWRPRATEDTPPSRQGWRTDTFSV